MAAMTASNSMGGGGAHETSSTTSHASSSRFLPSNGSTLGLSAGIGAGAGSSSGGPASSSSNSVYQPLSLADAMARANSDVTTALDEVLAERNKYCLEAGKLSNENMRIWSLMGRIRKENEGLKAKLAELGGSSGAVAGNGSPSGSFGKASPSLPPLNTASARAATSAAEDSTSSPLTGPQTPVQQSFTTSEQPSSSASSAAIMQQRAAAQQRSLEGQQRQQGRHSVESQDFEVEAVEASDAEASGSEGFSARSSAAAPAAAVAAFAAVTAPQIMPSLSSTAAMAPSADMYQQQAQQQPLQQTQTSLSPSRPRGDVYGGTQGGVPPPPPQQTTTKDLNQRAQELSEMLASAAIEPASSMPRVDGAMLPMLHVTVAGSVIKAISGKERDVASFLIRVENPHVPEQAAGRSAGSMGPGGPPRVWKVEKTYAEIMALDARLRQKWGKSGAKKLQNAAPPDKNLFKDHAPSRVDQRKAMLEKYLHDVIAAPLPDRDEIATFLCTDVVFDKPSSGNPLREGYLTKKGQNLGRWVTRYYVLRGSKLDFFEIRGGQQIGSINIEGAQIGRQQKSTTSDMDDNSYRHAFLVLEQRAPSTTLDNGAPGSAQLVRHVLCAESDVDRDLWVDALVKSIAGTDNVGKQSGETKDPFIDVQSMTTSPTSPSYPPGSFPQSQPLVAPQAAAAPSVASPTGTQPPPSPGNLVRPKRSGSLSRRFRGNSGNVVLSEQDLSGSGPPPSMQVSSPSLGSMQLPDVGRTSYPQRATSPDGSSAQGHDGMPTTPQGRTIKLPISGPMNGQPIPPGYKFGGKDEVGSSDGHGKRDDKKRFWQGLRPFGGEKPGKHEQRPVFGVPLAESVAVSSVGEGTGLPSVVYRCIEYLERRNASMEEGIYRLSGSSAVIKSLKDKFNVEGDVDLLSGDQYYDPHAIAGLLKTFLRELPSSVLTRELHLDFMRVNDVPDRANRIDELGRLVSMLPMANYALLRTLCGHLIKIIQHSDVNKMTMRNVGIVFSPTLAIPAGVFALFLTEFDYVFFTDAHGEPAPRQVTPADENPNPMEDAGSAGLNLPSPRAGGRNNNRSSYISGSVMRSGDGSSTHTLRNNRNSLQYNESEVDKILGLPARGAAQLTGDEEMIAAMHASSSRSSEVDESFLRDAGAAMSYEQSNASLAETRA